MAIQLDRVLAGGSVVHPGRGVENADIGIHNGRIAALATPGSLDAPNVEDITGLHVFPGLVDPHVHFTMGGGMAEYETDTAAATIGGVTSVFNILIDSGPYTPLVRDHRQAADSVSRTDYAFHLTLMGQQHLDELPSLVRDAGITSFKYFMSFRGEEGARLGGQGTTDAEFVRILEHTRRVGGVLAVHPENIEVVWHYREQVMESGEDGLSAWDHARPAFTEAEAVLRAAYLANAVGCPLYLVHLSSSMALEAAACARRLFPDATIFAETCPHFLTHTRDSSLGTLGKVNPPLRTDEDTQVLWRGLADGTLDVVGSDHVGRRREKKSGTIWEASAGFPGAATILPVLLSHGYWTGRLSLPQIAQLASQRPAQIYGVDSRKGAVMPGLDADLAIVDLEWQRTPTAEMLGTWCDYSLYEEQPLRGWPRKTYLRGQLVQEDGVLVCPAGVGGYLHRG